MQLIASSDIFLNMADQPLVIEAMVLHSTTGAIFHHAKQFFKNMSQDMHNRKNKTKRLVLAKRRH